MIETVTLENCEMEFARFGTGAKAFIIIPGLSIKNVLKTADVVAEAYKIFAEDYTIYFFDRRKEIQPGYTLTEMADDIAGAMKKLNLPRADIFGFSQGGMIAQDIEFVSRTDAENCTRRMAAISQSWRNFCASQSFYRARFFQKIC